MGDKSKRLSIIYFMPEESFTMQDGARGDTLTGLGRRALEVETGEDVSLLGGWRKISSTVSLEECNSTMRVPPADAPWWRQWVAYVGVGFLVAVGYMDPGNWATNVAAGSQFGYTLLIVVLLSSMTAVFLQHLSLKLGVVSSRDLAQACRDSYHPKGFIPKPKILTNADILYAAIGIMGATVMPHNLYLHSSVVQTRAFVRSKEGKLTAFKYAPIDCISALTLAFLVNASMLIMAAAVFHYGSKPDRAVADIVTAYKLLQPALGDKVAPKLFGIALLSSGQQATITGTLSGQIVMEGFLNFRIPPWSRRLITRLIAITPAVIVAAVLGDAAVGKLLVLSQVILSLTLTFSVVPLVQFTSTRAKMGTFTNNLGFKLLGVFVALVIAGLNTFLVVKSIKDNSFGSS